MPARCSFEGYTLSRFCVAVCWLILMPFSAFFSEIVLSDGLDSSHFCCQMCHNFCKTAIKNWKSRKLVEMFVCTTSYRQWKYFNKIPQQWFRAEDVDVHLHKKISTGHYIVQTASVILCAGSPKMARNEQVCVHRHTGSKFSKITLWQLYTWGTLVVNPYYSFSLRCQIAPQRSAKFRTTFLAVMGTSCKKVVKLNYFFN